MSIRIGEHVFDGPYITSKDLLSNAGVFAVIVVSEGKGALIDVSESDNVRECVENHPNRARWSNYTSAGKLCFAALYTPDVSQADRHSIEQGIRQHYQVSKSTSKTNDTKGEKHNGKETP